MKNYIIVALSLIVGCLFCLVLSLRNQIGYRDDTITNLKWQLSNDDNWIAQLQKEKANLEKEHWNSIDYGMDTVLRFQYDDKYKIFRIRVHK